MKNIKLFALIISIVVISFSFDTIYAKSNTETYFKEGRKDVLLNAIKNVKIDEAIPSEYSYALGGSYKGYEIKGSAGLLSESEKNLWDNISNSSHTCTPETTTTKVNCSDAFWNLTNLDYSRVDSENGAKVKGNFYALYKNAGTYKDKNIDVKLTIIDFDIANYNVYNGKVPVIGFYGPKSADRNIAKYPQEAEYRIGIFVIGVDWVSVKYEFFESGTNNKINLKGYTSYWDIDNFQGVHLLDNNKGIYSTADSTLQYSIIEKKPYIYDDNKQNILGFNSAGVFTEIFEGSSLNRVYTFTSPQNGAPDFSTPKVASGGIWNSKVINGGHKSYSASSKDGKDSEPVKENDIITYEVNYTNGSTKDKDIEITETLSRGLKYVQGSFKDNGIIVNPEVKENEDGSTALTYKGSSKSGTSGSITYSATVTSSNYETVESKSEIEIGSANYDLGTLSNHVTKPGTIIVKYLEEGSNKELLGTDYIYKNLGETYETSSKEDMLYNYKLVNVPENSKGTVSNDTITVTYYYKLKEGKLIVRHLEDGTNKELIKEEINTKYYGETYETFSKEMDIPNYTLKNKSINYEGVICQDQTIVVYYYRLNAGIITTHHYLEGTSNRLLDDEVLYKDFGESYTTQSKEILLPDYKFVSSSDNTAGIIEKKATDVNYYYELKKGKVTTRYLEKGTNKTLADEETKEYKYGESYNTEKKKVDDKYNLDSINGKPSGVLNSDNLEVIYYYKEKNEKIDDIVTIKGPSEIKNSQEKIEYKITYSAKVKDYVGEVNIVITSKLPGAIDEEKSDLDGGKYNSFDDSIVWGIKKTNFDSEADDSIEFSKDIKIVFKSFNTRNEKLYSEVRGNLTLDTTSSTICDYSLTDFTNKGTVVTKYIDSNKKEIATSESVSGTIGDKIELKSKEIEGYILSKKPTTEIVKILEETKTYEYVYEPIKYNIITKATSDGGLIIGDSKVSYGTDSKEKILITSDDGYYIKSVSINNNPYVIEKEQTKIELPSFNNVLEDKTIEVDFESAETEVNTANTASPVQIIALTIGILLLGGGVYFVLKKYNLINGFKKN